MIAKTCKNLWKYVLLQNCVIKTFKDSYLMFAFAYICHNRISNWKNIIPFNRNCLGVHLVDNHLNDSIIPRLNVSPNDLLIQPRSKILNLKEFYEYVWIFHISYRQTDRSISRYLLSTL